MNRRNFFSTLIKGVGVFSILPPAETYGRIWKAAREPVGIYSMLQKTPPSFVPLNLEALFCQLYALKEARSKIQHSDVIEFWSSQGAFP